MTTLLVCAAALLGLAIADLSPTRAAPWLLCATLAVAGASLAWRARRHHLWRQAPVCVCALALGAARGSLPDGAGPLFQSGASLPFATLAAALAPVRDQARASIGSYLPEPQASLAAGVLLGGSGQLDPAFRRDLQRSGLGHLVAIDGFKQVLVAAAVGAVAVRVIGARLALAPILATVIGYTLLSGGHASAVRAALMVGLAQVAAMAGRRADPLTSLGLATLGMCLLEPRILLDVGLQLSVAATLSLILLWPVVRRKLRLRKLPKVIAEPFGLSLAVTLGCLPVTLSIFQSVSLVSPLAHILAVPLLPGVLLTAALLAGAVALPLPSAVVGPLAWVAWLPSSLLAVIVRAFGDLPGAALSTGRPPPLVAALLAGLLLAYGFWHLPELTRTRRAWTRWRYRNPHVRSLAPVTIGAACLAAAALLGVLGPDGRATITALPLGRGQAVFVRGPTGRTALVVQGGTDGRALADQVAGHLAVWEHGLGDVVVLDPQAEKALGLTLARYPADRLIRASAAGTQIDLGAAQILSVGSNSGRLLVTSGPTTSAARPGSAD